MNPYLTEKARRPLSWRIPAALFMAFLSAVTVWTVAEKAAQGEWSTAWAGVFLLALFLWPVFATARHALRRRDAQRIARGLEYRTEESVPLESLGAEVALPRLEKRLWRLVDKGYLQNLRLDRTKRTVVLAAPSRQVEREEIIEVECPECGATNRVVRGRIGRCSYCEQPLMPYDTKKRDEP